MNRVHAALLAAVSFASLAFTAGCSSADDANAMTVEKGCLETTCEKRQHARSSACSDCTSACSRADYRCDSRTACEHSCDDTEVECSAADENECVSTGWKATLPSTSDQNVHAACEAAVLHLAECAGDTSPSTAQCTTIARVERPEMVKHYECITSASCDSDPDSLAEVCSPPPSTLGNEFCGAIEGCEPICTEEIVTALNENGAWLRDDVADALLGCRKAETCGDVTTCFLKWADALGI